MATREGTCVFHGCCCCYHGFDIQNIVVCCIGEHDCLCLRHSHCFSVSSKPLGCGLTTDETRGECCKVACFCCDWGLITPTKVCAQAEQILCCFAVSSLPPSEEYMPEIVCAYFFVQCFPTIGICVPAQECKALDALTKGEAMER